MKKRTKKMEDMKKAEIAELIYFAEKKVIAAGNYKQCHNDKNENLYSTHFDVTSHVTERNDYNATDSFYLYVDVDETIDDVQLAKYIPKKYHLKLFGEQEKTLQEMIHSAQKVFNLKK